jgi:hypothetical protein
MLQNEISKVQRKYDEQDPLEAAIGVGRAEAEALEPVQKRGAASPARQR